MNYLNIIIDNIPILLSTTATFIAYKSYSYVKKSLTPNLALVSDRQDNHGRHFELTNASHNLIVSNITVTVYADGNPGGNHSKTSLQPGETMTAGKIYLPYNFRNAKIFYHLEYDDPSNPNKRKKERKRYKMPPPT